VTLGDVCRIFELLHSGARLELDLLVAGFDFEREADLSRRARLLPVVPHVDPGGAMQ
jgi:hypothetical protein